MSRREILDFAILTILDCEVTRGDYSFVSYNNSLTVYPNIILEKDGQKYAVWVKASVAPKIEEITEYEKNQMRHFLSKFNDFTPLFASVGIGAADHERFDKSLALLGDEYYVNYVGFENVEI